MELVAGRSVFDIVKEALTGWVAAQRAPKPSVSPPVGATPQDIAPVIAPADQPWHAYRMPPR
jgi:hypothetical protein